LRLLCQQSFFTSRQPAPMLQDRLELLTCRQPDTLPFVGSSGSAVPKGRWGDDNANRLFNEIRLLASTILVGSIATAMSAHAGAVLLAAGGGGGGTLSGFNGGDALITASGESGGGTHGGAGGASGLGGAAGRNP
jgi:hypothetical protein